MKRHIDIVRAKLKFPESLWLQAPQCGGYNFLILTHRPFTPLSSLPLSSPPHPTPPSWPAKHSPERRNPIHKQEDRDCDISPHNLIPLPPRPKHPRPHAMVIRQQMADIPARRKDQIVLGHMRIAGEERARKGIAGDDEEEAAESVGEEGGCGVQRRRGRGGSG